MALGKLDEKQKDLYKMLHEIVINLKTKRAQLQQNAILRQERELYAYFHLKPALLSKVVKDMEAKTGAV